MKRRVRRRRRSLLWLLAGFVALVLFAALVLPFLWPLPPREDAVPPGDLADPDSRFVTVNGVELHYKEAGPPDAPCTVLLLHGFGASTFSWRQTLAALDREFRVVAFDRPGSGLSGRPLPGDWAGESPYSPPALVAQAVGLMDALGVGRAVLVGHSAGAVVAVQTAAQHPERVAGLVLESPALFVRISMPALLTPLLRTTQGRRGGRRLVRRLLAGSRGDDFVRRAFADPSLVTPAMLEGYRTPTRAERWDEAFWEEATTPRRAGTAQLLPALSVPALVISGDRDSFVRPGMSRRAATEIPDAEAIVLPGVGHMPHEEAAAVFNRLVHDFLRQTVLCGTTPSSPADEQLTREHRERGTGDGHDEGGREHDDADVGGCRVRPVSSS